MRKQDWAIIWSFSAAQTIPIFIKLFVHPDLKWAVVLFPLWFTAIAVVTVVIVFAGSLIYHRLFKK